MHIAGNQAPRVCFFVNGPPRLVLATALAGDDYRDYEKHLILLNQFGYRYDHILPHVGNLFDRVSEISLPQKRYSHISHFYQTYLKSYKAVDKLIHPGDNLVMFGIRSPMQKHLLKRVKSHGGEVSIYAESLAIERYFSAKDDNPLVGLLRRIFSSAFSYQHDYDRFFVYFPERYSASPWFDKLREMPDIYQKSEFKRLSREFLRRSPEVLQSLGSSDCCFFGQPLSNFDGLMELENEVSMLKKIMGNKKALVLPHPNEVLGEGDKYSHLSNLDVINCDIPNDFILTKWRPSRTYTYGSTIGLTYALHNPDSKNYFYPVFNSQFLELSKYKQFLNNIEVSSEFVFRPDQY